MAEPMSGIHPDAAELQSYADGEAVDERVTSHVELCAACREEVAAIRRVTAALSLGSTAPESLTARIMERRAAVGRPAAPARVRPRSRARAYMLPVGLAAAAALAIFAPRVFRKAPSDVDPGAVGAKGAVPAGAPVLETILTEYRPSSIDSVAQALRRDGTTAEVSYVTGLDQSARARQLADSVAASLLQAGVSRAAVTVRLLAEQPALRPLPAGAVGITVRSRSP
jgi:hypothetical protein